VGTDVCPPTDAHYIWLISVCGAEVTSAHPLASTRSGKTMARKTTRKYPGAPRQGAQRWLRSRAAQAASSEAFNAALGLGLNVGGKAIAEANVAAKPPTPVTTSGGDRVRATRDL
jgi:hypothetical protein